MRQQKFTRNHSSLVTLQLDCGLLVVLQTHSDLTEKGHNLAHFQPNQGQASNSKTQSYTPASCSFYKMQAPLYGYVCLAIKKSNFKECNVNGSTIF